MFGIVIWVVVFCVTVKFCVQPCPGIEITPEVFTSQVMETIAVAAPMFGIKENQKS
ncbi:MAG: hypothetical protein HJHJAOHD_01973 [Flavobacteriales bacterium]|nr:hypothetical protein [Flavobacteriales bacterium]